MHMITRSAVSLAVLAQLVLGACLTPRATAQTLDLGGVAQGPVLGERNGPADLAAVLDSEAGEILAEAEPTTGEARAAAMARAKVRSLSAYLLRTGSTKPWNESAPAMDGVRLAQLVGRVDALIERAVSGRNSRGEELGLADARRALALVHAVGAASGDPLRRAMIVPGDRLAIECARALAGALAPLSDLATLIEGPQNDDPWPVLADARAGGADRSAALPRAGDSSAEAVPDVQARIKALPESPERAQLDQLLAGATARGAAGASDLRLLASAADALGLLATIEGEGKPRALAEPAIAAARARIIHALAALVPAVGSNPPADGTAEATAAAEARTVLEALGATVPASQALLALRASDGMNDAARNAVSDAMAALLASEVASAGPLRDGERARMRAATRIADSCAVAERLEQSLVATAPRDLRDMLRQFDRDARVAVRALPEAFRAIASDPMSATDPANLSALERVRAIESDRARIIALQGMIDSIAAIRPQAGRSFVPIAKRMTKLLTDPLRRGEGQLAFAALESQYAGAFPFAYEEELKRREPRAVELAAGVPERVIARAAAIRAEWCDAIGRGDFGGDASRWLDMAARLCRALRDLDQVIEPIDRAAGDRLGTWGGWPTRRAMISPATQDPQARAVLTCRSFVAANDETSRMTFERDLMALESAIPLVRLTAALERKLSPVLRGDPDTVGAQLAPLLAVPAGNAFLAAEWTRLLALHRAMVEAEFARRTGDMALLDALQKYLAALAKEIEQAAFGAPRPIARIPGFDGTQPAGAEGKPDSRPGAKPRDR